MRAAIQQPDKRVNTAAKKSDISKSDPSEYQPERFNLAGRARPTGHPGGHQQCFLYLAFNEAFLSPEFCGKHY